VRIVSDGQAAPTDYPSNCPRLRQRDPQRANVHSLVERKDRNRKQVRRREGCGPVRCPRNSVPDPFARTLPRDDIGRRPLPTVGHRDAAITTTPRAQLRAAVVPPRPRHASTIGSCRGSSVDPARHRRRPATSSPGSSPSLTPTTFAARPEGTLTDQLATSTTSVSGRTPSYFIASAPAALVMMAWNASMSATSMLSPTR
jgi:hypothetical protein